MIEIGDTINTGAVLWYVEGKRLQDIPYLEYYDIKVVCTAHVKDVRDGLFDIGSAQWLDLDNMQEKVDSGTYKLYKNKQHQFQRLYGKLSQG